MAVKQKSEFRITDYPMYHMAAIQHRNFGNLTHALRPHDVSPVEWRVLAILNERDGHNIAYLAEIASVERSNMSRIVEAMERDGLVARRMQAGDKRQRLVCLTEHGQNKFNEILPVVMERYAKNFDGLSKKDIETLMRLLRRIHDNVHRGPGG